MAMLNNRRVHTIHIIALLFSIFPSGFADELFIFPNGKSITWRFDEGIHFLFNGIGSFSPGLSGKKTHIR